MASAIARKQAHLPRPSHTADYYTISRNYNPFIHSFVSISEGESVSDSPLIDITPPDSDTGNVQGEDRDSSSVESPLCQTAAGEYGPVHAILHIPHIG